MIVTVHGLDWQREKWGKGFASKYIHFGEKMAVKFADEIIVLHVPAGIYTEGRHRLLEGALQRGRTRGTCTQTAETVVPTRDGSGYGSEAA